VGTVGGAAGGDEIGDWFWWAWVIFISPKPFLFSIFLVYFDSKYARIAQLARPQRLSLRWRAGGAFLPRSQLRCTAGATDPSIKITPVPCIMYL